MANNSNAQTEPRKTESKVKSYYLIKNQFIDSKCVEGEISKLKAVGKMLCLLLNSIKKENNIDCSVLEDLKFIVNDYIGELDHIYNN